MLHRISRLFTFGIIFLFSQVAAAQFDEDLLHAAARGDQAGCEYALARGANPNYVDRHTGETPLWRAVCGGHDAIVSLLLDAGAAVDLPVCRAQVINEPKELELQRGRARSVSSSQSSTPSLRHRRISVSSSSTKREDEPSSSSRTPLSPRKLSLRLETLIRISPRSHTHRSSPRDTDTNEEAKTRSEPTSAREVEAGPLADAAPSIRQAALTPRVGSEPSFSDASTPSTPRQIMECLRLPIHEAVARGLTSIVRLLLPCHADGVVYERDHTGLTLGDIALTTHHFGLYKLLKEHEFRKEREELRKLLIPLLDAVRSNDFDLVKLIVTRSNQNIDTVDTRGNSPIEVALRLGHNQVAALLVVEGAQMPSGFIDELPQWPFALRDLAVLYPKLAKSLLKEMRRKNIADADFPHWLMRRLAGEPRPHDTDALDLTLEHFEEKDLRFDREFPQ